MEILSSFTDLVGNTPIMRLTNIERQHGLNAAILAKLEYFNPAGSIKDRVAKALIDDAESKGLMTSGSVIIEPTSGNTGIGLAAVAASRGYKAILTMPDTMSVERQNLLKAYGAEVVLTDGALGLSGAIDKARELSESIPGSFMPGQFENPTNPAVHRAETGPELFRQVAGNVDIFVAGVGTGGTISGIGEFLKSQNSQIRVIAVEPASSPMLSEGRSGAHGIQGIGANFLPEVLNRSVIDEVIAVKDEDSMATGREIVRAEGLLVGISSGAAIWAAIEIAKRAENENKTIVAILPDTGERYLSTAMFADN